MGRGIEQRPAAGVVVIRRAGGEQLGGEGAGREGLPGSARAAEEVCVPGGGKSRYQRHSRSGLVPGGVNDRLRNPFDRLGHAVTAWTSASTAACTESRSWSASITLTRSGCRRATSS